MDGNETIRVLNCPFSDYGTQKCHLGQGIFQRLHLKLGQCVTISQRSGKFVCKAWIRRDKHDGYLDFDGSVRCEDIASATPIKPVDSSPSLNVTNIEGHAVSHFKEIEVEVVMHKCEDVLRLKNASSELDKTAFVCNTLDGKVFSLGCVIGNGHLSQNGIYFVKVTQIAVSKTVYGFVTRSSKIVIKSVVSKERYEINCMKRPLLGGLSRELGQLKEMVDLAQFEGETLGRCCPKSVLLRGPPGCGKNTLVKCVAGECGAVVVTVKGPQVTGSRPGESEQALARLFEKAKLYSQEGPAIIFFDELESFCGKKNREQKSLTHLCHILDKVRMVDNLVAVAATNRPSALHAALRRTGRFDREIFIGIPSQPQRLDILTTLASALPLADSVHLPWLAEATPGFVGADLQSLLHQAYNVARERVRQETTALCIRREDVEAALHVITPSTQRGSDVLVDTKPVLWSDIGGLESVKAQVKQAIELPLTHPQAFARLGLSRPKGVLLYGPPGCAKTTLVRAAATACHVTFLSVSGAQLYSPFVGDSEKKISEVFQQARAGAPCILFIDEIESVVGSRSQGVSKGGGVQERVLSTLLNEMDGIGLKTDSLQTSGQQRWKETEGGGWRQQAVQEHEAFYVNNHDVLVVAATNRPDMLDAAILRPGRIDKIIYVPTPDEQAREEILKVHTRRMSTAGRLDLKGIAQLTECFSGADLENLCREAALHALSIDGLDVEEVQQEHFTQVLKTLSPSLSEEQLKQYQKMAVR